MRHAKPVLAGGAAAIILAGAMQLFPRFDDIETIAPPDSEEFALGQTAFGKLLREPSSGTAGLDALGFEVGEVEGSKDSFLLSETEGACRGRGIYWLRENPSNSLAITAPHRGSDRHTGQLAAALFEETQARAAAWNSAPRRPTPQCSQALDIARERDHLFSAFALAFAQGSPDGLIIQLHGFDGARRDTIAAREAGLILSNGTNIPGPRLLNIADCLSLAFAPTPVLVYPGDTGELGALTNAQGQLLNEAGFTGFIHIEIAAELRAALVENGALRAKFASCLMENAA